jgi:uncharacterized protein (TIGR00730 family)
MLNGGIQATRLNPGTEIAMPSEHTYAVTVFGSSRTPPENASYENARMVGRAFAGEGWTVITGGYRGTMEAASLGAKEAGGSVIGVTTDFFTVSRGQANPYVDREIRMPTYGERLLELLRLGDGYVVMPGGHGTLAELFLAWELVRNGSLPRHPIVLFGARWRALIDAMAREFGDEHSFSAHLHLLRFADTPEETVEILREAFRTGVR